MKAMVKRFVCMVLILVMLMSIAITASAAGVSDFSDVSRSRWSYKAVCNARAKGYVNGVGGNRFDPSGKITYGQLAQILYNKAGRPDYLCYYTGMSKTWERPNCSYEVTGGISSVAEAEAWKAESEKNFEDHDFVCGFDYVDLNSDGYYEKFCEQFPPDRYMWNSDKSMRDVFMEDCQDGKWYTKAYVWCYGLGMVQGKVNDFASRGDVLRGLVALQYYRFDGQNTMKLKWERPATEDEIRLGWCTGDNTVIEYVWIGDDDAYITAHYDWNGISPDVDLDDWLSWAFRMGLIAGDGSKSADEPGKKDLKLERSITREEVSQFLYNFDDGRIERETAKVRAAYAPIAAEGVGNHTNENTLASRYGLSCYKDQFGNDTWKDNEWITFIPYNFGVMHDWTGGSQGYANIYADQLFVYPKDVEGKYRGNAGVAASYDSVDASKEDKEMAADLFDGKYFIGYEIMWRDRYGEALAIHSQGVSEGWFNGSN